MRNQLVALSLKGLCHKVCGRAAYLLRACLNPFEAPTVGMGLVSVLMAAGILGIIGMVLAQMSATQSKAQKDLDKVVASMAVVRTLNLRLMEYCPPGGPGSLSWVPSACGAAPNGTYVEIVSSSGSKIINAFDPANPLAAQQMGDLLVRAKCVSNTHKILKVEAVDAKRLAGNSKEPWFDISPKIPLACDIDR